MGNILNKLFGIDFMEHDIFERLPNYETCCYCILLRPGCIMACFFNLFTGVTNLFNAAIVHGYFFDDNLCHVAIKTNCNLKFLLYILAYIDSLFGIVIIAASLYCLVGLYKKDVDHLTIYNLTISLYIIASIMESLGIMLVRTMGKDCIMAAINLAVCLMFTVLMAFVYSHFLMVMNSYRRILKEETGHMGGIATIIPKKPPTQRNPGQSDEQNQQQDSPPQNQQYGYPPQGQQYGYPPQGQPYGYPPQGPYQQ